ncbi:hypothetical protein CRU99_10795 [Malaciobacter mytili]|uniref:N-acetyltransferase domain-containing protein n=1 Tax=Malaciobacter mytili LMG 24559 TaxID=1032238 RepID=A0AAX2AD11_9BACT|nr:GNAT family N-acetyltransferase [Malaciobacter mytili]AXH14903.1 acetyltransferase [Malaciobacter mytili LMG 24559]RXI39510.1 hypothetical protein CRU99_10795 [Malaciobacter mytili]RXK14882.1 hypothetical protein CP985_11610 [Malaciobacter mytili LMG 24559]
MQIIIYDKSYLNKIPELFVNSIYNSCKKDYTLKQLEAWAGLNIDYKFWENKLKKTKPFLAILDGKLVGFAEFYNDYIDCFYVDYTFQKKGIGKALLTHIIYIAKQNNIKKIKVDASITSKPFFEKFGFKKVKRNLVKKANEELINYSLELIL